MFAKRKILMKLGENEAAFKLLIKVQVLNPLDQQMNGGPTDELKLRKKKYDDFSSSFAKKIKFKWNGFITLHYVDTAACSLLK